MFLHSAYLIVICDPTTNAVKGVTIWSSPEWEQSRCLDDRTYVLYRVKGKSYQEARDSMLKTLNGPYEHRYKWALEYMESEAVR